MRILRVLLVDDDPEFLGFAETTLSGARYSVTTASGFDAAAATLRGHKGKAVVLSDLTVGGKCALSFLKDTAREYPHTPFTVLAHSPPLEAVIEALKQGAYDFLRKPVAPDILCHSVARSMEKLNLCLEGDRQEGETKRLLAKNEAELERVKNISDFKGFLISTTAHDFNSTLTVLDGYHQLIKDRCHTCSEPLAIELLKQARRSVKRLRSMSATLLDYEAAERGVLLIRTEGFDLNELLNECISFYRPFAEQKQVFMDLEEEVPSLTVQGDRGRVMQVMDNLLYNSVKFTPPRGEIRIGARSEDGATVTVWVRDTGIGISKKLQEKLLQDGAMVGGKQGNAMIGLGFSICRKLIEVQNGRIWLESAPGKGTKVYFSLPV